MPNGTSAAVDQATRLEEIGFPEFTAKLITDVFDAIVAANLRQTEAYLELLGHAAKTLTAYINDTKDDIGGDQILAFLAELFPPPPTSDKPTLVAEGETLSTGDLQTLNAALVLPDGTANAVTTTGPLAAADLASIEEAVSKRIAANKYDLLQQMVKLGVLRLVVETGVIETRLTFTTYGSSFYQANASKYHTDTFKFRAKAKTGGLISRWVKASASTAYTSVNVRTADQTQRDISGSNVQIFGRVEINFKTDYMALNS